MPNRKEKRQRAGRAQGRRKRRGNHPSNWELGGSPGRESEGGIAEVLELLDEVSVYQRDSVSKLLLGIAAADLSIVRFINGESKKSESVAKGIKSPFTPEELIEYEKSLAAVMAELVKKEELLLKKLRILLSYAGMDDRSGDCLIDDDKWDAEFDDCDEAEDI